MKPDKIVVGLGNPGTKYQGTRHNVGYMVLAKLAERFAQGKPRIQFQGNTLDVKIKGTNILLLCPTTYMNLSGNSISSALRFYKLTPSELLVVCDDVDLPVSKIRFRTSGGSGGQKGLQNTIERLGTNEFARLRVGIGRPPQNRETADYVLSHFGNNEKEEIQLAIQNAADAVELWISDGDSAVMNRYN
ncbi:MAG: aminoacyl-tRNA hydrolase [Planctomycetia bacterium]|nr:aminoacyl-tRNA hydrolase [Planctomycetia bacterium]